MSSPSLNHPQMKCYPQRDRKDNRKRCVGRTPATPGSSRDASSRPPLRPPARPRPLRGGCSPRLWSCRPCGLQRIPGRTPTQAAHPPQRQRLHSGCRPSRPGSVYKRLLAVPRPKASPRQPSNRIRLLRVPAGEDRSLPREEQAAGRGLTSLSYCFLYSLYHRLAPFGSSQGRKGCLQLKLSLGSYQGRVSYQQLPRIREFIRNNAFQT